MKIMTHMAGLREDHLQKLHANFKGNIRISEECVRLQKTVNTIESIKCP